jgi:hypothetical protein
MKQKPSYVEIRFVLGLATVVAGLFAANLALFSWVERLGVYYIFGEFARYVCAYGGFAAMISGSMLINDFLVLWKVSKVESAVDHKSVKRSKKKETKKVVKRRRRGGQQTIEATTFAIFLFMLLPLAASSIVSYTATVVIQPEFGIGMNEYIWISGNDDFVRKLNKTDLGGPEILSWDTGLSYPFGCEYRKEDGNEYIYVVNYHGQPAVGDKLFKFHANNGTVVNNWDISGYSDQAYGLAWNGSRWFIAEGPPDPMIIQVDPSNPTVQERNFTYLGMGNPHGLAWDGSYLWVVDQDTDKVYQIDVFGNIQTSWDFLPTDPTGIAYDSSSGHLWIARSASSLLYEYFVNGTEINNWDPVGSMPQGVDYVSIEES